MKRFHQAGFTMIELIVVIVILGILVATALPRFLGVSDEGKDAPIARLAASADSAMSINYAGCASMGHVVSANKCVAVTNCTDVSSLLQDAQLGKAATNYTVTSAAITAPQGNTVTCTIASDDDGTRTATFTGIRTVP